MNNANLLVPTASTPETHDLSMVIEQDLGPSASKGNRRFWHCPFHDDRTPSLTITPDGDHFKCFGCGKYGDAINWLRDRHGLTFTEAKQRLGETFLSRSSGHQIPYRPSISTRQRTAINPKWVLTAKAIVEECAVALHERSRRRMLHWLVKRGLFTNTIKSGKIGFNIRNQRIDGLWVPAGITIPWFRDGVLCAINVRRLKGLPKYQMVSGSRRQGLYFSDEMVAGRPTLLVEGELDALLGWQEIQDVVNVATLGSATSHPDDAAIRALVGSPLILLGYDGDTAGKRASKYWQSLTARCWQLSYPCGKDLTEFHARGRMIRPWIKASLSQIQDTLTRHPTHAQKPT